MGCPVKVEVGEGEGLGLGVVVHLGQSGLAVVKVIPPDSDDGNVDEHDDGGQDVGSALQWDGKQIFGLVEGLWHVDCWLPHS